MSDSLFSLSEFSNSFVKILLDSPILLTIISMFFIPVIFRILFTSFIRSSSFSDFSYKEKEETLKVLSESDQEVTDYMKYIFLNRTKKEFITVYDRTTYNKLYDYIYR